MSDVAPGPEPLGEVEAALEAFWSVHDDVPERVRREIGIAALEIAANILEHGHAVGFQMELRALADEVEVEFTDSGDPAEVDLECVCMPDEMAERGRGLAMAQSALRLLSYCRDELGNHWRLVSKAFPGTPHRS